MQGLLAGDVRALAVTQPDRLADYPTVPPITEVGLGTDLTVQSWHGIFAAGGTPAATVTVLNSAILTALADPAVRRRIERLSIIVFGSTPDAFAAFYAVETNARPKWCKKPGSRQSR
jgi:tripartite-type tricarboxylate transporter receptor subunit TctC